MIFRPDAPVIVWCKARGIGAKLEVVRQNIKALASFMIRIKNSSQRKLMLGGLRAYPPKKIFYFSLSEKTF